MSKNRINPLDVTCLFFQYVIIFLFCVTTCIISEKRQINETYRNENKINSILRVLYKQCMSLTKLSPVLEKLSFCMLNRSGENSLIIAVLDGMVQ